MGESPRARLWRDRARTSGRSFISWSSGHDRVESETIASPPQADFQAPEKPRRSSAPGRPRPKADAPHRAAQAARYVGSCAVLIERNCRLQCSSSLASRAERLEHNALEHCLESFPRIVVEAGERLGVARKIGADVLERGLEPLALVGVELGNASVLISPAIRKNGGKDWLGLLSEEQAMSPPISWVGPPFHPALGLHAVEQTYQRHGLDLEQRGEPVLVDALVAPQSAECLPQCFGKAQFRSA